MSHIIHFYVFYKHSGDNVYDRTCGTKEAAESRINTLKKHYSDAFYLNDIPKGFKYFY